MVLKEKLDVTKVKAEPNGIIKIFEPTHKAGEINRCLVQNQIDVESIIMKSISLEDYFLGLKGTKNA
ncbi:hypothetical protein FACS1894106_5860 [Spirochaetia bacterium]|nr:hypothetical protein FACS1894106_5860 [Spirochaetia bacterium]